MTRPEERESSSRGEIPVEGAALASLPLVRRVARRVAEEGGRLLLVGGAARDRYLGRAVHDLDVEVFGISAEALRRLLAELGPTREVGRSFPVFLVDGVPVDFALPAPAAQGLDGGDLAEAYARAARRRDLTMNALAIDPLTDEWLDPLGGRHDIDARRLREADAGRFGDDPLRALRVARFAALFEMRVEPSLARLCAEQDLSGVAPERVFRELSRLLQEPAHPSLGLAFLEETGLLRFFPEIEATVGVPQDPRWHPEGCVFTHTKRVVDCAAALRTGREDDALLWGALCHDLGKPATTTVEPGGPVRALDHAWAGVAPARALLERLRAPKKLVEQVTAIVLHHLAPLELGRADATPRAYRRLARRAAEGDVSLALLARVARADVLGRTTPDALAGRAPACDAFEARAEAIGVERRAEPDVVLGRHLLARGVEPGPAMGSLLDRCRAIQDETGWRDPQRILDAVLDVDVT